VRRDEFGEMFGLLLSPPLRKRQFERTFLMPAGLEDDGGAHLTLPIPALATKALETHPSRGRINVRVEKKDEADPDVFRCPRDADRKPSIAGMTIGI
jgi:hypothetical protein